MIDENFRLQLSAVTSSEDLYADYPVKDEDDKFTNQPPLDAGQFTNQPPLNEGQFVHPPGTNMPLIPEEPRLPSDPCPVDDSSIDIGLTPEKPPVHLLPEHPPTGLEPETPPSYLIPEEPSLPNEPCPVEPGIPTGYYLPEGFGATSPQEAVINPDGTVSSGHNLLPEEPIWMNPPEGWVECLTEEICVFPEPPVIETCFFPKPPIEICIDFPVDAGVAGIDAAITDFLEYTAVEPKLPNEPCAVEPGICTDYPVETSSMNVQEVVVDLDVL